MRNEIQTVVSASAQQNGRLFHTMMTLLFVHKMGGPLRRLSVMMLQQVAWMLE